MRNVYKYVLVALLSLPLCLQSCGDESSDPSCGSYNGKKVSQGPQGGCYYLNSSGNKEYVDRSYCNC